MDNIFIVKLFGSSVTVHRYKVQKMTKVTKLILCTCNKELNGLKNNNNNRITLLIFLEIEKKNDKGEPMNQMPILFVLCLPLNMDKFTNFLVG